MHARIDQLLSLRDGEPVEADVRAHVRECAQCAAEVSRLVRMREALRSMPLLESPDMLNSIAVRASARPLRRRPVAIAASVAAFVACAIAFVVVRDTRNAEQFAISSTQVADASAVMTELMAQSRQLEEILAHLPDRPSVQRVSLSATVDSIEERIQWLDWQLAYSSDAGLDQRQAQRLWSERVELMDSLVKVRYAEAAPMAF